MWKPIHIFVSGASASTTIHRAVKINSVQSGSTWRALVQNKFFSPCRAVDLARSVARWAKTFPLTGLINGTGDIGAGRGVYKAAGRRMECQGFGYAHRFTKSGRRNRSCISATLAIAAARSVIFARREGNILVSRSSN
jgi:hypothetical protein